MVMVCSWDSRKVLPGTKIRSCVAKQTSGLWRGLGVGVGAPPESAAAFYSGPQTLGISTL
eukprot:1829090-Amphidinium_carterae.1